MLSLLQFLVSCEPKTAATERVEGTKFDLADIQSGPKKYALLHCMSVIGG